jgi:hypothetical protein
VAEIFNQANAANEALELNFADLSEIKKISFALLSFANLSRIGFVSCFAYHSRLRSRPSTRHTLLEIHLERKQGI